MPENNFQEKRIENRRLYLVEKRNHELKFTRQIQKAIVQYDRFINVIDFLFNQRRLLETAKSYFSILKKLNASKEISTKSIYDWGVKAHKDLKEGKGDYINSELRPYLLIENPADGPPEVIAHIWRKMRRAYEKKALQAKLNYQNCFLTLDSAFDDLFKIKDNPMFEFVDKEIRENFNKTLKGAIEKMQNPPESEDVGEDDYKFYIVEINKSMQDFIRAGDDYKNALKSYKPSFKVKAKETTRLNLSCLEEEIANIQKNKRGYFNTLEGLLLAFCTYQLEPREIKNNRDYLGFLYEKADEKLAILKESKIEELVTNLNNLRKKGHISEDEYIFINKILQKQFESEESLETKVDKEDFEDVQLRALVISDYDIPTIEALRIAKLTQDENIDVVSRELRIKLGSDLASLLIRDNPELFLMDKKQTDRYIARFNELANLSGRYSSVDDFNPLKQPHNFSTFDALKDTKNKLYAMIHETSASLTSDIGEINLSEIDRIKLQLAREGFEPDMAWAIIKGFYFHGRYFTGSNRRNKERLEDSIRKNPDIEFDQRQFDRELRKLMRFGAIEFKRGYSLNPHTKEIKSEALRIAINYSLAHHPLEKNNN